MKIIELKSENVARLNAVEIKPDGSMVIIGGKNGNGKSSVLDSITMALAGAKAIPRDPIHDGKESAKIEIDLGEYQITRTFDAKGSKLTIRGKDGGRFNQTHLNELIKGISLDPSEFIRKSPSDQAQALRDMLGIDVRPLDEKRKATFDQRTDVNRDHKKALARLEEMPHHDDAPDREQSIAEASQVIREAHENNRAYEQAEREVESARAAYLSAKWTVDRLRGELAEAEEDVEKWDQDGRDCVEVLKSRSRIDLTPLEAATADLEMKNRMVRENAARAEAEKQATGLLDAANELTEQLGSIDAEKRKLIESAEFPIDGLSFGESGLVFNGHPFEQASDAEKLRVSLSIALAMQPEIRVVLMKQGAFLDEESLAMVGEMAAKADAQVWVERVGDRDEGAIIIEDGAVRVKERATS